MTGSPTTEPQPARAWRAEFVVINGHAPWCAYIRSLDEFIDEEDPCDCVGWDEDDEDDDAEEKLPTLGNEEYVRAAVNEKIREQFGQHRLVHAPDGGCTRCPLSATDKIHEGAP